MADNTGKVEYSLRVNNENIESDLEEVNKKVEEAAERSADAIIKIEKDKTIMLNEESDKVVKNTEKAAADVSDAWKGAAKESKAAMSDIAGDKRIEIVVEVNTKEAEASIDKIIKDKDIEVDVKANVKEAKADIASLEDAGKEASGKIGSDFGTVLKNIGNTSKNMFSDMVTSSAPFGDKIDGLATGLSGAGTKVLGLGKAFISVGADGVRVADDVRKAMNNLAASTGLGSEEIERYQGVLEDIYANNYGESFDDIAGALGTIREQMGPVIDSWDDEQLQNFTESAFALRDTFEYDIADSVEAANTLMEQFGIDGQDAFNLITVGAQESSKSSAELLGSINEYSGYFGKLGMDADDMFKIFEKGSETGAFSLDQIGNSMKELSTRVTDGSDVAKQGFELIGLNADEMAEKFAAGGDSAKEAFDETIDALANLEDPLEQNQAGVDLFGSMWEELGSNAVDALADIEDGSYAVGDELEKLKDIKYDDLASMFETLSRAVDVALVPLGEALMPILLTLIETVLPIITELLTPLIELVSAFLEPIMELINSALQPLIDMFTWLMDEILTPLIELLQTVLLPVFESVMEIISGIVSGSIGRVIEIFENLIGFIVDIFTGDWEGAWEHVKEIFRTLIPGIDDAIAGIKQTFSGIIDFITGIFTGDWEKAWNGVKDIFGGIWEAMKGIFKAPVNWIIDGINIFIRGLNKIKIPDWSPVLPGKGFNIKEIPRLKIGMDYIPVDDFPALLHAGEMVLNKSDAETLRSVGGVSEIEKLLSYSGKQADISKGLQIYSGKTEDETKTYTFNSIIEMDAKEVAKATSVYTDNELSKIEAMSKRGV